MIYRTLPKTDIPFPAVSFGAWAGGGWDWGGCDDQETIRAIHAGFDHGMMGIDTAPVYGAGHSESVVGRAIKGRRSEVTLATKCGFRWDFSKGRIMDKKLPDGTTREIRFCLTAESIRFEVEESLRRLGTDVIDLYQCHAPDLETPLEETMGALVELRNEGKIRAFGVSNFSYDQVLQCLDLAPVASTQSMYNLMLRDVEKDLLPLASERNMGVLSYSSLLFGLLTGKVTEEREFPLGDIRRGHHLYTPEWRKGIMELVDELTPITESHGITFAQLALAWVVNTPGITTALAGARTEKQAIENAKAGSVVYTDEEYGTIKDAADRLRRRMLWK